MQLEMAPVHNRLVRTLHRANRELWQTNARLSRQAPGILDSAAATLLDRVRVADERVRVGDERVDSAVDSADERVRGAEAERDKWHEEADRLQAVRADLEAGHAALQQRIEQLEALRSRKVVRLALALSRLRPGGR